MTSLSIIGCGNAAGTLGHLWQQAGVFSIEGILNRSLDSGRRAAAFIGAGTAVGTIDALPASDIYLVGTPDKTIDTICSQLAGSGNLRKESAVFHLSGALASSVLDSARQVGAAIASIHPVKSFADPANSANSFTGTWCGCEGDAAALKALKPAFEAIGARLFDIDAEHKSLYHAASVIACNYLVALEEVSLQTFEQAGVPRLQAMQILEPILHGTVDNIVKLDSADALTGPIARGDTEIVEKQLEALKTWKPEIAELYKQLGRVTTDLSEKQGHAPEPALARIRELFEKP